MECLVTGAVALAASAEGTVVLGLALNGIVKSAISAIGGVALVGAISSSRSSASSNQCDVSCSTDSLRPAPDMINNTVLETDDSSQLVEP